MITYYYCVPAKEFEQLTSFGGSPVEYAVKAAEKFSKVTGQDYLVVQVLETIEASVQRDAVELSVEQTGAGVPLSEAHLPIKSGSMICPNCHTLLIDQIYCDVCGIFPPR
jgi:hypothetical protein